MYRIIPEMFTKINHSRCAWVGGISFYRTATYHLKTSRRIARSAAPPAPPGTETISKCCDFGWLTFLAGSSPRSRKVLFSRSWAWRPKCSPASSLGGLKIWGAWSPEPSWVDPQSSYSTTRECRWHRRGARDRQTARTPSRTRNSRQFGTWLDSSSRFADDGWAVDLNYELNEVEQV